MWAQFKIRTQLRQAEIDFVFTREKRIISIQMEKIKAGVYKAIFLPLSTPVTIIVTTGGDTYGEQSIFGSDPYTFAHCNYI